jgi:hypothetical protein
MRKILYNEIEEIEVEEKRKKNFQGVVRSKLEMNLKMCTHTEKAPEEEKNL